MGSESCASCVLQTGSALLCSGWGIDCDCYDVDNLPPHWGNIPTQDNSSNLLRDHYIANWDIDRNGFVSAAEYAVLTPVQQVRLVASGWVVAGQPSQGTEQEAQQPPSA